MTQIILTPRAAREQTTFRALLNAMSRPGTIATIAPHEQGGRYAAAVTVMEALVDHEVTFAVRPELPEVADAVLRLTGSHQATLAQADYVLCNAEALAEVLRGAKDGTLEYPDRSATIVCLVEAVGTGGALSLIGPGIKDELDVRVEGLAPEALAVFSERNLARPLGLDLVLIAPEGQFTCLPRYTNVTREET